jgi:alkylation response protein AidB-like acyl-CoA dehydrogenase
MTADGVSICIRVLEALRSLGPIFALGGMECSFSNLLALAHQRRPGVVELTTAEDVAIYTADIEAGNAPSNES